MARGSIVRQSPRSWRLKFDLPRGTDGKRQVRVVTVRGTLRDAEKKLAELLHQVHVGGFVDPSKITVGEWLRQWIAGLKLTPRSHESYTSIIARLDRAIGTIPLQRLRPVDVQQMRFPKVRGGEVAPATARQARRVLKSALGAAFDLELVARNVVTSLGSSRTGEGDSVNIPAPDEISAFLDALRDSDLFPIVHLALATGARRGELLAIRWQDVDLDARTVRIERTLERTKSHGARFKPPKTKAGRRTIEIPLESIEVLRAHRRSQLELRMQLGMGKLPGDALLFSTIEGAPLNADALAVRWRRAVNGRWKCHALRHAHASALIAAKLDIISISRRLGHSSPDITLRTYSHMFSQTDTAAADAIGKVLGTNRGLNNGRTP